MGQHFGEPEKQSLNIPHFSIASASPFRLVDNQDKGQTQAPFLSTKKSQTTVISNYISKISMLLTSIGNN